MKAAKVLIVLAGGVVALYALLLYDRIWSFLGVTPADQEKRATA